MEEQDEIIVFRSFENSIDANIIKTKLDANGIPCFLTEENLANLYPAQSFVLFGVRLHIFDKDKERVSEILQENFLSVDETTKCPNCQSEKVEIEYTRKATSRIITLLVGLLLFIGFPLPKIYRCQDCKHEF
jgi:DNA-directed RNA polymerase subunit RPC12/RpoP